MKNRKNYRDRTGRFGFKYLSKETRLGKFVKEIEKVGYKGLGLGLIPAIPALVSRSNLILMGGRGRGKSAILSFLLDNMKITDRNLVKVNMRKILKTSFAKELEKIAHDKPDGWQRVEMGPEDFFVFVVDDLANSEEYHLKKLCSIVGSLASEEKRYKDRLVKEKIEWNIEDCKFWFGSTIQPRIYNQLVSIPAYEGQTKDRLFYYTLFNPFPQWHDWKFHHPNVDIPIEIPSELPELQGLRTRRTTEILTRLIQYQGLKEARALKFAYRLIQGIHAFEREQEYNIVLARAFVKAIKLPLYYYGDFFYRKGEERNIDSRKEGAELNYNGLELFIFLVEKGGYLMSNKRLERRLWFSRRTLQRAKTFLHKRGFIDKGTSKKRYETTAFQTFLDYFKAYSKEFRNKDFQFQNHNYTLSF